ncbi:hypothetical protein BEI_2374 [Halomonas beimenensis]|uniref:Uncharacterized protein n=1 Tax=Halomonas beimenensis TaxID=475662 RepID=A0A291P925_9GAMM|nr:hypothetical protein BEI_2374 [Halomonas beimenensis]
MEGRGGEGRLAGDDGTEEEQDYTQQDGHPMATPSGSG